MDGSQPAASGELHPRPAVASRSLRRSKPPRHPLILDGFSDFAPPALRRDRLDVAPATLAGNCACTFYPVFKEPALPELPDWPQYRRLGNLTSLPKRHNRCQDLFCGFPIAFARFPAGFGGRTIVRGRPGVFLPGSQALSATKKCSNLVGPLVGARSNSSGLPAGSRSVQSIYAAADALSTLIRWASPPGPPYWLARGGPTPRAARQAHSLSLVRAVCYRKTRRARPAGRLARHGATLNVHHGLPRAIIARPASGARRQT
jgi:hypothetical protein